jgi:hypothetical protein
LQPGYTRVKSEVFLKRGLFCRGRASKGPCNRITCENALQYRALQIGNQGFRRKVKHGKEQQIKPGGRGCSGFARKGNVYLDQAVEQDLVHRLSRLEGHVRGIRGMLQEHHSCDDVLIQISAVRAAINQMGALLLENH